MDLQPGRSRLGVILFVQVFESGSVGVVKIDVDCSFVDFLFSIFI